MASPIPKTLLDDRLPDWWRALHLSLDGHVEARRGAIIGLAGQLDATNLADAVLYAHGAVTSGESLIETIRSTSRDFDDAFAGDVGDLEPAAMIAAAVAHLLATRPTSAVATLASLLTLSADWTGQKPVIANLPLGEYAGLQLEYAAAKSRASQRVVESPSLVQHVKSRLANAPGLPAGEQVHEPQVTPVLEAYRAAVEEIASRVQRLAQHVEREQRVGREQLAVHTWLLEEWCETADTPWAEVPPAALPIVAGIELADRTAQLEPSADATVLLSSTLAKAGADPAAKVAPLSAVETVVALLPREARAPSPGPAVPLAAARDCARGGANGWKSAVRDLVGTRQRSLRQLAEQAYRESLIISELR